MCYYKRYRLPEWSEYTPIVIIACTQLFEHFQKGSLIDFNHPDHQQSSYFVACVLISIIETLRGFVDIYGGHNSFPEIFLPISTLLLALAEQENLPNALKEKIRGVEVLIKERTHEHHMLRRPLQMRKQKPVPIKLFNPKFEENFVKGRDYDPDRERAEQRKLKKLIKQEAKGAARELRKDNYFLFEVKKRDKAMQEEERAEKYGKAFQEFEDCWGFFCF